MPGAKILVVHSQIACGEQLNTAWNSKQRGG